MSRRQPLGLADFVGHEARNAIHDIRQKLFEEAWFGRIVTGQPMIEVSRDTAIDKTHRATLEDLWGRAFGPQAKDREEPEPER